MKLQFSLATLLVCMTVLAVVCAVAVAVPVSVGESKGEALKRYAAGLPPIHYLYAGARAPNNVEIAWRLALYGPPAIAATLVALWLIRRLKSPNRPPVG